MPPVTPPGPRQNALEWFRERGIAVKEPLPPELEATLAQAFRDAHPEVIASLARKIKVARTIPDDSPLHEGALHDELMKFKEFCKVAGASPSHDIGSVWTELLAPFYEDGDGP